MSPSRVAAWATLTAAAAAAAAVALTQPAAAQEGATTPSDPEPPVANSCLLINGPSGRPVNYGNCVLLSADAGVRLYWTADAAANVLRVAFAAPDAGWVAFGWGSGRNPEGMLSGDPARPNLAVVGSSTAGGDTTATAYRLMARASVGVQPVQSGAYTNMSVVASAGDGGLIVTFERALSASPGAPPVPLDGTAVSTLWAVGETPDAADALAKHTARGSTAVDFTAHAASAAGDPLPGANISDGTDPAGETGGAGGSTTSGTAGGDDDDGGDGDDGPACFPADAVVSMAAGGGGVPMAALRVGDVVASGPGGATSPVFLFTHADAGAVSSFVALSTMAGPAGAPPPPPRWWPRRGTMWCWRTGGPAPRGRCGWGTPSPGRTGRRRW